MPDMTRTPLMGRADRLNGLKENVIIGRKIPVGTGVEEPVEDYDAVVEDAELAA